MQAETCSFIKKETLAQVFPVNFAKFLGTPFLTEHLWLLFLFVFFPSRSNDNGKKWWFGHNLTFLHKKMIRHKLLACNSKWNVFLKIFYPPSLQVFGLILKMRFQQSIKFWSFLNERDYLVGTAFFLHSYSPLLPILSKSKITL